MKKRSDSDEELIAGTEPFEVSGESPDEPTLATPSVVTVTRGVLPMNGYYPVQNGAKVEFDQDTRWMWAQDWPYKNETSGDITEDEWDNCLRPYDYTAGFSQRLGQIAELVNKTLWRKGAFSPTLVGKAEIDAVMIQFGRLVKEAIREQGEG